MGANAIFLYALGGLSLLSVIYEGTLYWHDLEPNERLLNLWGAAFVLLVVLWINADSRKQPRLFRPFEYAQLVLLYWVPYLPYYFWRTRGVRGLLMLSALVVLYLSGWLVQWLLYVAR